MKKDELNKTDKLVYKSLPVGVQNAISQEELAKRINTDRRTIGNSIRRLRQTGLLIGSSRSYPNSGYYLIHNQEEFNSTLMMLKSSNIHTEQLISIMNEALFKMGGRFINSTNELNDQLSLF